MVLVSGFKYPSAVATNALRIDGEQDVLQLNTRSNVTDVTMICWARIVTNRSAYSGILSIETGAGHSTEWNELITETDGFTLSVYDHITGNVGTVGTMTVGTWHKVGIVIKSGSYDAYFGTEGVFTLTKTTGTIANITTNDYQGIGATQFSSTEWFNGRIANVRIWNAALTQAEITTEFNNVAPVRTTNLLGHWLPKDVTSGTVLVAATGANLIDGNGGGTPDYTIEAGPTI